MSVIPLKVVVRARPLIQKETDEGCQSCLNFIPYEPQIVLGKDRSFTYDFVFRPTDPQISVYEDAVKPLIQHIFKGSLFYFVLLEVYLCVIIYSICII